HPHQGAEFGAQIANFFRFKKPKSVLSVTADRNANLKLLKNLSKQGKIQLHSVAIEGNQKARGKINKELPMAVLDSPFALLDQCVLGDDDTHFKEIEETIGKHNHGDVLHLERHLNSGRDLFVTDDRDFLDCRKTLCERFGVTVLSCSEIQEAFATEDAS
ncbi:MAG: hypothetical protein RLN85_20345, partial [Pseudomonadales bacterium]